MSETAATHDHGDHSGSHSNYMKIWYILLVMTIAEYFYAMFAGELFGIPVLIVGLVAMASYKATLVALHFMHLKFEGKWILAMLVPTAFLVCVLIIGLTPDVALHYTDEDLPGLQENETAATAPAQPGQLAALTVVR